MLARNAESLYWIGRYVERADDTARILDVTVHQLLEDSSVDPDQASRTLLRVLGIKPPDAPLDVWSLTDIVAFSRDTEGGCSIVESISAARAGNVTLANAVGNGVADDKLVYTYVPTIIEYYLGEKPLLANVDTYRCWLDEEREEVLDRIDELVIKPVEGSGGYGIVFGPDASEKELAAVSKKIGTDPRGWIAQPVVQLSTVPTQIDTKLAPRHVDLRPFAVNDGDEVWVLPGGLTRVALPEGSLVVNSSQGGGSKDTWVLASRASVADRELGAAEVVRSLPTAPRGPRSESGSNGSSQQRQQQQSHVQPPPNGAQQSQQQ